jgi:hypothetical protein
MVTCPKKSSPAVEARQGEEQAEKLHLRNTTLILDSSSAMSESRSHDFGSEKVLRV